MASTATTKAPTPGTSAPAARTAQAASVEIRGSIVLSHARPGDEQALLDCLHRGFACRVSAERWRSLHLGNPAGPSLVFVARKGERIVAEVGLLRRRLRTFGRTFEVGHFMDATTDPDFRRLGLRRQLGLMALAAAHEEGIELTSGVANDQSLHSASKYEGRQPVSGFPPVMVRVVHPLRAAFHYAGAEVPHLLGQDPGNGHSALPPDCAAAGPLALTQHERRRLERQEGEWGRPRFDDRHDTLFTEAAETAPIRFLCNGTTLTWRYQDAECAGYRQRDVVEGSRLLATILTRPATLRGTRFLVIMELVWAQGASAAAESLLVDAERCARDLDCDALAALAMDLTPGRALFASAGYREVPPVMLNKGTYLMIGGVDPAEPVDPRLLDGRLWSVSWGDGLIL